MTRCYPYKTTEIWITWNKKGRTIKVERTCTLLPTTITAPHLVPYPTLAILMWTPTPSTPTLPSAHSSHMPYTLTIKTPQWRWQIFPHIKTKSAPYSETALNSNNTVGLTFPNTSVLLPIRLTSSTSPPDTTSLSSSIDRYSGNTRDHPSHLCRTTRQQTFHLNPNHLQLQQLISLRQNTHNNKNPPTTQTPSIHRPPNLFPNCRSE
ncbi:hypothetical protein UPYG_G00163450 [Umbra pygmaea]|uniref:Uncharacterized protein n=1 Tax=Umbra pygmaea TaxID=75934 RepID=A0ABD0WNN4_UMBPY